VWRVDGVQVPSTLRASCGAWPPQARN
jgi:hypothetical protein